MKQKERGDTGQIERILAHKREREDEQVETEERHKLLDYLVPT